MNLHELPRVFVIGMGEVGSRLASALVRAGATIHEVTRSSGWEQAADPSSDGLRLLCVRENDLSEALQRLARVPGERVVAVQNGWIRPLLDGLEGVTRGLIWFTSKGDFFRLLRPSPFSGPWAEGLSAALTNGGVASTAVDEPAMAAAEAEKMGFNCVVGLPLAVHRLTLSGYLATRPSEAEQLFTESVTATAMALGVRTRPGWWETFLRSAEPLGWMRASTAKALPFRNQAVANLARKVGLEVPVTRRLLDAWRRRKEAQA